ncbi:unnamed protein product [Coregonus sp. 'balchen']|nr:unnamed protein product [Coregonus sp. 'balchen']
MFMKYPWSGLAPLAGAGLHTDGADCSSSGVTHLTGAGPGTSGTGTGRAGQTTHTTGLVWGAGADRAGLTKRTTDLVRGAGAGRTGLTKRTTDLVRGAWMGRTGLATRTTDLVRRAGTGRTGLTKRTTDLVRGAGMGRTGLATRTTDLVRRAGTGRTGLTKRTTDLVRGAGMGRTGLATRTTDLVRRAGPGRTGLTKRTTDLVRGAGMDRTVLGTHASTSRRASTSSIPSSTSGPRNLAASSGNPLGRSIAASCWSDVDQRGAHVETEPLCVLDFFVTENLQRHGYGLELFSFMLQHKKVEPVLMAYDRPSPKFISFLEKHYCLKNSVPQVNNFVVFDGFFANRSAVREEQKALPWPLCRPAAPPLSPPLSGLVARGNLYSRHINTRGFGLLLETQQNTLKLPGLRPVLRDRETDIGGQTEPLGHRDTDREPDRQAETETRVLVKGLRVGVGGEPWPGRGGGEGGGPLEMVEKGPSEAERDMGRGGRSWVVAGGPLEVVERDMGRGGRSWVVAGGPLEMVEKGPSEAERDMGRGGRSWVVAGGPLEMVERDRGRGGSSWVVAGGPLEMVEKGPSGAERDRGRGGWSWTVGERCCNTAQWVRQEYRSTRPW